MNDKVLVTQCVNLPGWRNRWNCHVVATKQTGLFGFHETGGDYR